MPLLWNPDPREPEGDLTLALVVFAFVMVAVVTLGMMVRGVAP